MGRHYIGDTADNPLTAVIGVAEDAPEEFLIEPLQTSPDDLQAVLTSSSSDPEIIQRLDDLLHLLSDFIEGMQPEEG